MALVRLCINESDNPWAEKGEMELVFKVHLTEDYATNRTV